MRLRIGAGRAFGMGTSVRSAALASVADWAAPVSAKAGKTRLVANRAPAHAKVTFIRIITVSPPRFDFETYHHPFGLSPLTRVRASPPFVAAIAAAVRWTGGSTRSPCRFCGAP